MKRGLNGYTVSVYRAGRLVGHRHSLDNRLAYATCYAQSLPQAEEPCVFP